MTPEERQLLAGLFDRIRGAAGNSRDRDAEALIAESVRAQPYAPYLLAQTVIVQEETLKAAAARIEELEGKTRELEEKARQQEANANAGAGGFLGGIGKSIFGSEPRPQSVPRVAPGGTWGNQAAQQPQQAGGPWAGQQQQAPAAGGSFLKGALTTAAGVAGGMMLANSLSGLFSGHNSNPLGIGSGFDKAKSDSSNALDDRSDRDAGYSKAAYDADEEDDGDDTDDSSSGWGSDDGTSEA